MKTKYHCIIIFSLLIIALLLFITIDWEVENDYQEKWGDGMTGRCPPSPPHMVQKLFIPILLIGSFSYIIFLKLGIFEDE